MVNKPSILVTGGAGYIGSHISLLLAQQGYQVIIVDVSPSEDARLGTPNITPLFYQSDFANTQLLHEIFTKHNITAVMHCAAFIEVGQSVKDPLRYYENNVGKTTTLLSTMRAHNVNKFIFSSSCAVYGVPQKLPLTEDHLKNPISPYGRTKLMVELILEDCSHAYGLQYIALRYFNAAGATPEYNLGEQHQPETHLIPLVLRAALNGTPFTIFGTNYPTPDGTCLRDFLHVRDIAQAHLCALEYLEAGNRSDSFNLGTGIGISVQQMVSTIEQVTNTKIKVINAPQRSGDPSILVADSNKAQQSLAWRPHYSVLEYIVQTAYDFEVIKNHNQPIRTTNEKNHE